VSDAEDEYLAREAKARVNIDRQLAAAGRFVHSVSEANVSAGLGVAVREFVLEKGHGRVDYLLFVNGQPAGVIEAKPEGTTLTEVEHQSGKYVEGLPEWIKPPVYPLAFIYESTGFETRFTNGYDPDARGRRVFTPGQSVGGNYSESDQTVLELLNRFGAALTTTIRDDLPIRPTLQTADRQLRRCTPQHACILQAGALRSPS
jgi:type I site-specific restriction endonuclease